MSRAFACLLSLAVTTPKSMKSHACILYPDWVLPYQSSLDSGFTTTVLRMSSYFVQEVFTTLLIYFSIYSVTRQKYRCTLLVRTLWPTLFNVRHNNGIKQRSRIWTKTTDLHQLEQFFIIYRNTSIQINLKRINLKRIAKSIAPIDLKSMV